MIKDGNVSALRHNARLVVRELGMMADHYRSSGLSNAQCHGILELAHQGELNNGELAELLHIDKSNSSRTLAQLVEAGLVQVVSDPRDGRRRVYRLTDGGREHVKTVNALADGQVQAALDCLLPEEQGVVLHGMALYAKALKRARLQAAYTIRPIEPDDNASVKRLVRQVLPEFVQDTAGTAFGDPELDDMHGTYGGASAAYYVLEFEGRVVGGAGFAPLLGGAPEQCELQKMYFMPEVRGLGLGAKLLGHCLQAAKAVGFTYCYLETFDRMYGAQRLYRAYGFKQLEKPQGKTGHFGCNAWYGRDL